MGRAKRTISKTKTYGFQPWSDQIDAINSIMTKTGAKEATILRKLVDEALVARRLREAEGELEQTAGVKGIAAALETIQAVVMKLVRQGDTSLRTQDVSLALLQETLAEARAGRRVAWDGAVPRMKEERLSARQIDERFEKQTEEARSFAYGIAKEIKDEQD
jgi:hypothetical protein